MMAESSENGDYDLVQARQVDSSQNSFDDDIIGTKPTWTLPPKPLPARSQVSFHQSIVFASLVTAFSLTTLLVLLSQIRFLLPERDFRTGSDIAAFLHSRVIPSSISCDLVSTNASAFENAFTIDLRSQIQLSFATAKFIDVVWDLVIGQGGRFLLAWISYVVFMDGLARLMETSAVSYQLYASVVFETSTLASIWCSLKAVSTGHGWRGRAFLIWFGLATMYVLGYPTLMSAATGYLNPSDIQYRLRNDILVPPDSDALTHCLQVHNAPAIGLDDDYLVQGPSDKKLERLTNDDLTSNYTFFYTLYRATEGESLVGISPFLVLIYIPRVGHSGLDVYNYIKTNNLSSNPTSFPDLPFVRSERSERLWWVAPDGPSSYDLGNRIGIELGYCFRNEILPWDFDQSTECLSRRYFVWGFCSVLLYIILSLQLVWTLGMFMVWLDANIYSKLCRRGRKMHGSFRNVLDLAEAIKEVLGDDLCAYSNSEIARRLVKSGHGLQFYSTSDADNDISHIGISSFERGENLHLDDKSLYGRPGRVQQ